MAGFDQVLLDVWREACRHIEIGESTSTIAEKLSKHMPLEQVIVRRIDDVRPSVETVALWSASPEVGVPNARTDCTDSEIRALREWCKRGELAQSRGQAVLWEEPAAVMPQYPGRDVLSGPLTGAGGALGVLTLVSKPDESFGQRHVAMAKVLLESFSAALENDHGLREMAALREAAEADRRSLLNRLGRNELGDAVIGADSGLRLVMERAELVSRSDVPVLVLGETGTGKELLARLIHKRSRRAAGPIMRVNCGAIPHELIDSELFGHERGAFTGAVGTRKGWFERADGGTLFLDEIGELSLAAQVRLLRILQDGWLERIGGHQPIKVDVRVIAATHCDLASMVTEGKFREDLWYRIAVFPILLPPVRDRKEDVPALARHFAERAAIRFGLPVLMPSEDDISLLIGYSWPGNIRELATVMDRAAIIGNGRRLEVAAALGVMAPQTSPLPGMTGNAPQQTPAPLLPLDDAIKRHIERALTLTQGRVEGRQGAAALLKINPHTLRARMRKLGIDWTKFRAY